MNRYTKLCRQGAALTWNQLIFPQPIHKVIQRSKIIVKFAIHHSEEKRQ